MRAAPLGLEGIVESVREARSRNLPIRVAGTGHSLMPLVATSGCLISTEHLTRILRIDGDTIEVEAGARLIDLEEAAWESGLSLEGGTNYARISVGGIVATGSHGSGRTYGTLSSRVVGLTLVGPDGVITRIDTTTPDLLRAARIHLGMLGVVYSLALRCERAYHMRVEYRPEPLERAIGRIDSVMREHEHVSLYWFPGSARAWWYLADRAPGPAALGPARIALRRLQQAALNLGAGSLIFSALRRAPRLTQPLIAAGERAQIRVRNEIRRSVDAYHYLWSTPSFLDAGQIIDAEQAGAALETTFSLLGAEARAGRHPINMAVQLRRLGPDDALLSPTLGRPSIAIECVTAPGTPHAEAFLRAFAHTMAERHGGRPHWAKQFFDPAALAVYGARRAEFARIQRARDPEGVFVNDLCRAILGPADYQGGQVA